jgi:hypothetical protein
MNSQSREANAPEEAPNAAASTFFPRGAIFFFVALLAFYGIIWLVIYFLMIARS